jgi:hypothetical protein
MKKATYWSVLKECFWGPLMLYVNGLYGAISAAILVKDELLPDKWKSNASLLDILHKLPWREWVIIFLVLNILLLIEGALRAVRKREEERDALSQKLDAIKNARPNVQLSSLNSVVLENGAHRDFISGRIIRTTQYICLCIVNDPHSTELSATARGVGAKVRYFIPGGEAPFLEIDGRWAGTDEASLRDPRQSRTDLLRIDLGIGEERRVDIAFRDMETKRFFAWNNDNYNFPDLIKPEHEFRDPLIDVQVRLRGLGVDKTFAFSFVNLENGLEILTRPHVL